ncbi:hypothetical protein [Parashewanella tropica]|uniref:hypothetical protein n=1 Tax=Parashewanella tropica TaxID=2547970 RepID=UPI001059B298|nr:hypothetical protein [Parashewanella tropica]
MSLEFLPSTLPFSPEVIGEKPPTTPIPDNPQILHDFAVKVESDEAETVTTPLSASTHQFHSQPTERHTQESASIERNSDGQITDHHLHHRLEVPPEEMREKYGCTHIPRVLHIKELLTLPTNLGRWPVVLMDQDDTLFSHNQSSLPFDQANFKFIPLEGQSVKTVTRIFTKLKEQYPGISIWGLTNGYGDGVGDRNIYTRMRQAGINPKLFQEFLCRTKHNETLTKGERFKKVIKEWQGKQGKATYVVAVDDLVGNLIEIAKACQELRIPCITVHMLGSYTKQMLKFAHERGYRDLASFYKAHPKHKTMLDEYCWTVLEKHAKGVFKEGDIVREPKYVV